jgi:hypothetical protein
MSKERRLKRHVLELRRRLSYAEVNDTYGRAVKRDRKRKRKRLYRLVRNLPSLSVRMDGTRNHGRAHLHVSIGKQRHVASIAIDNAEILAGTLTTTQKREVQDWVLSHRQALTKLWTEMQAGRPVDALICELQGKDDVPMLPRGSRTAKGRKNAA